MKVINSPQQESVGILKVFGTPIVEGAIATSFVYGSVQKYWANVQRAIARVKEAIQNNWCANPTGLFIASCKKGVKPEKPVVDNTANEWFT